MNRQILLIDDSAMLRRIATNVLNTQPARYEVISCTRASEGFARACGGETAAILVDERIAGAADADFCRRLLQEPRTATLPIVLLRGRNAGVSPLETLPDNVVETLGKPFAPEQLASVVNAVTQLVRKGASLREMRRALQQNSALPEQATFTDQLLPPEIPVISETPSPDPDGETSIRAALHAAVNLGCTGVVRFCHADAVPTKVFVDGGRLLVVITRDGAAYSGRAAEDLPAKISPATLQEAAAEQSRTGVPFLLTLGARGLVSKATAGHLLRRFGQRHFARLWTVPARSLQIDHERLEALPGFALRLEPLRETVDEWLLGTLRFLTGADLAAEIRHLGLVGTPHLHRRAEAILTPLRLDAVESEFIRRVNGRHDLPTMARSLSITTEEAFVLLHRFRSLDVLEYRTAPLPFVVTPRTNVRRVLPLKR